MAVGVDQRLDRLVAHLPQVAQRPSRGLLRLQAVDENDPVRADHHRHIGDGVADRDVEILGDLIDALRHRPRMAGESRGDGCGVVRKGKILTSQEERGWDRHRAPRNRTERS